MRGRNVFRVEKMRSDTEDEMLRILPVVREGRTRQDRENLEFFSIIWGD